MLAVKVRRETPAAAILSSLRKICLSLPNAHETMASGHPTFRVNERIFAVFEEYRGELTLAVQVGKPRQRVFLEDSRFIRTPYLGQHGWVSLRLSRSAETAADWEEIASLIRGSYSMVASRKR
ncbi:MAG TPA: MmcQ/YjbR family DNA-binding protein [Bryobacteraceae bacterium]|nr:MmcQ/YjbR family DNA-binding protein [Bryobacteraceae bacterium]